MGIFRNITKNLKKAAPLIGSAIGMYIGGPAGYAALGGALGGGGLGGAGLDIPSLGAPAPSKDAEPTAPQLPLGF